MQHQFAMSQMPLCLVTIYGALKCLSRLSSCMDNVTSGDDTMAQHIMFSSLFGNEMTNYHRMR